MARTLLDVCQKAAVPCRLDPEFTSFSYDDETQMLVDFANQAVRTLRGLLPWVPTLEKRGTIAMVAGTRLYDVAADCSAPEIFNWSYENRSDDYQPLEAVTLDWLKATFPDYQETQGTPQYVYMEDGQLGFAPIPDTSGDVIGYMYPDIPNTMSSTSATFPYPDDWLDWIENEIAFQYMDMKGMNTEKVERNRELAYFRIYAQVNRNRPQYIQ